MRPRRLARSVRQPASPRGEAAPEITRDHPLARVPRGEATRVKSTESPPRRARARGARLASTPATLSAPQVIHATSSSGASVQIGTPAGPDDTSTFSFKESGEWCLERLRDGSADVWIESNTIAKPVALRHCPSTSSDTAFVLAPAISFGQAHSASTRVHTSYTRSHEISGDRPPLPSGAPHAMARPRLASRLSTTPVRRFGAVGLLVRDAVRGRGAGESPLRRKHLLRPAAPIRAAGARARSRSIERGSSLLKQEQLWQELEQRWFDSGKSCPAVTLAEAHLD